MLTVGSLFSGAGLLDAGLHQAGVEHAWFVEREPDRRELLTKRWPGRSVHDDVRTVGAHNLEPVDGIVGGFPCKGVSGAGLGTGLAHPETALWAEFARIVGEVQPAYVLVENVARILTLHGGSILRVVVGDLAALGFDVAWDCVRAADVGAPHGRDRWFAIARHPDRVAGQAGQSCAGAGGALARPRALKRVVGSDGVAPTVADTRGGGRRPDERHLRPGEPDAERGRPAASDTDRGRQQEQQEQYGERRAGLDGEPRDDAQRRGLRVEWGEYELAVRRWEAIHGPAPAPLTRVRRVDDGGAKLHRLRAGVDRRRLSALGDGVHVYIGRLLGDALMELAHADREARDAA